MFVFFKIELPTQEISLLGKGVRICDGVQRELHTVRIIYQNRNISKQDWKFPA